MKIGKSILGIAGEYYVAAELGKRNVYAQLTLGNQKRTDLLIFSEENEKLLKIEVKCKQGPEWPNCKGIYQENSFIVFVDFQNIDEIQRPDFYILSAKDWGDLVREIEKDYKDKHPDKNTQIKNNVLIFLDNKYSKGQPYEGCGIKPKHIERFKECWDKILSDLKNDT